MESTGKRKEMLQDRCVQEMPVEVRCVKEVCVCVCKGVVCKSGVGERVVWDRSYVKVLCVSVLCGKVSCVHVLCASIAWPVRVKPHWTDMLKQDEDPDHMTCWKCGDAFTCREETNRSEPNSQLFLANAAASQNALTAVTSSDLSPFSSTCGGKAEKDS